MREHEASRTLVKSPPELWLQCSDPQLLARHLGDFGDIRITRLEPENTVAWEGEHVRGTVRLEPAGWGTKVTLSAVPASEEDEPEDPAPPAFVRSDPPRGLFSRLLGWIRGEAPAPDELPAPEDEAEPEPEGEPWEGAEILVAALESLGQAHHRPYSRA